jgi:hypothetical protein
MKKIGVNKDIFDFLSSTHIDGRSGFTDEGWMFNPDQPESKFVELCVTENWDYAKSVADTRNKEAIEYCDLFRKFIEHIKKTPDYIELNRDKQINKILQ